LARGNYEDDQEEIEAPAEQQGEYLQEEKDLDPDEEDEGEVKAQEKPQSKNNRAPAKKQTKMAKEAIWDDVGVTHYPQIHPFDRSLEHQGLLFQRNLSALSPEAAFKLFCGDKFIDDVVDVTNDWGLRSPKAAKTCAPTTRVEFKRWIGLNIMMGIYQLPNLKLYWEETSGFVSNFGEVMTRDRFKLIRSHVHFIKHDAPDDGNDKLVKVRPLLNYFVERCSSCWLPGQHLSLDEQMVKCLSKYCRIRVRMPSKPIKDGIK
jgi:hypothetical protein